MSSQVEARITENNIVLPPAPEPAATYLPYRVHNNVVYISGQLPIWNGEPKYVGKLGKGFDVMTGQAAARLCGMNVLAQLKDACDGDLDRVEACLRLGGFVNCTEEFTEMSGVMNGASELMTQVFGDEFGMHARAAVGVSSLPFGVTVEVDAVFALKA